MELEGSIAGNEDETLARVVELEAVTANDFLIVIS